MSQSSYSLLESKKLDQEPSLLINYIEKSFSDQKNIPKSVGRYIHKSLTKHTSSLLFMRNDDSKENVTIYELIHDPVTGKKMVLGRGRDAVVREGRDLKSGRAVAIKIYPLYKKSSTPREFSNEGVVDELKAWQLSQDINRHLPGTFVKMEGCCLAGDKSTEHNQNNLVFYVVTEKLSMTLSDLIKKNNISDELVKSILVKLLDKHKKLISLGYCYADANFCNVLLDNNSNPVFCDPISITPISLFCDPMIGLHIGLMMSLTIYFFSKIENATSHTSGIADTMRTFLDRVDPILRGNSSESDFSPSVDKLFKDMERFRPTFIQKHWGKILLSIGTGGAFLLIFLLVWGFNKIRNGCCSSNREETFLSNTNSSNNESQFSNNGSNFNSGLSSQANISQRLSSSAPCTVTAATNVSATVTALRETIIHQITLT